MVLAVDAIGVEQLFHVDRQGELVVLFLDLRHQRLAFAGAAGVQLQQAVATAVQLGFQGFAGGAALFEQRFPFLVVSAFHQLQQA
ncbi:hypothetical protein D9M68_293160 [compost metagenome]